MARGVSKELEDEICKVLEESVNARPGSVFNIPQGTDRLRYDAISYLEDVGAFGYGNLGSLRLTAQGRDYWEKLNAPRWYWFRRNWFPASVAAGTILFSGAAAAANILNLVT
ncbi:MAG: hypothetical protein F4X66_15295 [Chloroflexi bacterium]|nr:hypothetical protein [Chloroflexota bacterium]MYE40234.1 hypothetical protein [Chloroflexota bacterium]